MNYEKARGMHMAQLERRLLYELASDTESKFGYGATIVNIGIAAAYDHCSMLAINAGAPQARLIGIDIEDQGEIPDYLTGDVEFVIGDSGELWRKFVGPIHMLFVDGDHTYEGVSNDIFGWAPKVWHGGYMAFHDYGHYGKPGFEHVNGVKEAVDEFVKIGIWEHVGDVVSIRYFRRM